jgi:hypothetical protein
MLPCKRGSAITTGAVLLLDLRYRCNIQSIYDGLSELLTAWPTKKSTLIMIGSTDRSKLTLSRLATPLTDAATRGKIDGKGAVKLVTLYLLHKKPPLLHWLVERSITGKT